MYLKYKKDLIFEHPPPQAINNKEMPVILLKTSVRAKLENWFDICLTVVTLVQGAIYEGFRYANLQFGKIENVILRIKTPYLVCHKMETLGFIVHFNAYEVLETEELDLIRIDELFDYYLTELTSNIGGVLSQWCWLVSSSIKTSHI